MSTAVHQTTPIVLPARTPGDRRTAWQETDAAAWSLLTRLADLPPGHVDRTELRDRVIELYLPLARYLAQRFRNCGEPLDDLIQVANLALVRSVDGFEVMRGVPFPSYAIPMITGELKRHFRDKCWDVRVPRRVQEARLRVNAVVEDLTQTLGRPPTVGDLAAHLDLSEEVVIEGLESGRAYRALSLSVPARGDDGGSALGDLLGAPDQDLELAETREALRPLLARLPAREQRIIALRFFGNCTQSQIGAELGPSQMHVSRLLSKSLQTMRRGLLAA